MDIWRDPWADEEEQVREDQKPTRLIPATDADSWVHKQPVTSPGWGTENGGFDNGWSEFRTESVLPPISADPDPKEEAHEDPQADRSFGLSVEETDKEDYQDGRPAFTAYTPRRRSSGGSFRSLTTTQRADAITHDWNASDTGHFDGFVLSSRTSSAFAKNESDHPESGSTDDFQHPVADSRAFEHVAEEIQPLSYQTEQWPSTFESVTRHQLDQVHDDQLVNLSPREHADSAFTCDTDLVRKVFPLFERGTADTAMQKIPSNIISSTTARRTWYRLSRLQPMREVERGEPEETYVRVGWSGSEVRGKTLSIVEKWATEHRLRGRLFIDGGSTAPFAWSDGPVGQQVPPPQAQKPEPHIGKAETASTIVAAPFEESSLTAASPVIQFGWSSVASTAILDDIAPAHSSPLVSEHGWNSSDHLALVKPSAAQSIPQASDSLSLSPAVRRWDVLLPPVSLSKPLSPTTANQHALAKARLYQEQDQRKASSMEGAQTPVISIDSVMTSTSDEPPRTPTATMMDLESAAPNFATTGPSEDPGWGDFFTTQEVETDHQATTSVVRPSSPVASVRTVSGAAEDDEAFEWGEATEPIATDVTLQSDDFDWAAPVLDDPIATNATLQSEDFQWTAPVLLEHVATNATLQSEDFEWAAPVLNDDSFDQNIPASPAFAWSSDAPNSNIAAAAAHHEGDKDAPADNDSIEIDGFGQQWGMDGDSAPDTQDTRAMYTSAFDKRAESQREIEPGAAQHATSADIQTLIEDLPDLNYMLR